MGISLLARQQPLPKSQSSPTAPSARFHQLSSFIPASNSHFFQPRTQQPISKRCASPRSSQISQRRALSLATQPVPPSQSASRAGSVTRSSSISPHHLQSHAVTEPSAFSKGSLAASQSSAFSQGRIEHRHHIPSCWFAPSRDHSFQEAAQQKDRYVGNSIIKLWTQSHCPRFKQTYHHHHRARRASSD
jgi:hypothetical protein